MKALLLLGVLASDCAADSQKSILPCDKHDHQAQQDLAANAARSKVEREACGSDGTCIERVLAERDAYVFERCKLKGEQ